MELSAEQERAKSAILNWFRSRDRKPWFYLAGYAGTGKTSVTTAITSCIEGNVVYAAPTAKAALIMRKKGCLDPRTIHSLIYRPAGQTGNKELITSLRNFRGLTPQNETYSKVKAETLDLIKMEISSIKEQQNKALKEEDKVKGARRLEILQTAVTSNLTNQRDLLSSNPIFDLNLDSSIRQANLVVIDEVSMVGTDVMTDILSFNIPVLVQGDMGQLPPVKAVSYFSGIKPDFNLTEVHRQAKDSPIIYLATRAREGKPLIEGVYGNCIVSRTTMPEEAMAAEQIIVGTHEVRWATNDKVRKLKGYEGVFPCVGEKVICRNNDRKRGLLNGDRYTVTSFYEGSKECRIGIINDDIDTVVNAHKNYFLREEPHPFMKGKLACLDHSAAITCHSAQGDQFESVYLYNESIVFRAYAREWLYTGITRASDKVVISI